MTLARNETPHPFGKHIPIGLVLDISTVSYIMNQDQVHNISDLSCEGGKVPSVLGLEIQTPS
jgi:hypothetical protein